MKKLIGGFFILLLAVVLGFLVHRYPRYLLITDGTWRVEMSVWLGLAICVISFLVFYWLFDTLKRVSRLSVYLRRWRQKQAQRKIDRLENQACIALVEMQWDLGRHLFLKAARRSNHRAIDLTGAAYAAHRTCAYQKRNQYLLQLEQKCQLTDKVLGLIKVYFYMDALQWELALRVLQQLQKKYAQDSAVLYCLVKVQKALGDWDALKNLLPLFRKHCDRVSYLDLMRKVYSHCLSRVEEISSLQEIWSAVPKVLHTDSVVVIAYVKAAELLSCTDKAVLLIERALRKEWNVALLDYYGEIHDMSVDARLRRARFWLKKYPREPALFLCLGRLCFQTKRWEESREYLCELLALESSGPAAKAARCILGRISEATGDLRAALEYYRAAV